eukprot:210393-Prorocentrum_minimum.AAC.1
MKHGYILTKDQSEQSLTCTLCPQPDGTLLVVGNAARLGETARAHTLAAQLDRAPGTPTRQIHRLDARASRGSEFTSQGREFSSQGSEFSSQGSEFTSQASEIWHESGQAHDPSHLNAEVAVLGVRQCMSDTPLEFLRTPSGPPLDPLWTPYVLYNTPSRCLWYSSLH